MKQVIVLRSDIGMSTGKMVAQACHAAVGASRNASGDAVAEWESSGAKKVAVEIDGEEALLQRYRRAKGEGLPTYMVKDAGHTELEPGTITALGIGPGKDGAVDKVTKDLALI